MKQVLSTTVFGPGISIAVSSPTFHLLPPRSIINGAPAEQPRPPAPATPPIPPADQASRLRDLMRDAEGDEAPHTPPTVEDQHDPADGAIGLEPDQIELDEDTDDDMQLDEADLAELSAMVAEEQDADLKLAPDDEPAPGPLAVEPRPFPIAAAPAKPAVAPALHGMPTSSERAADRRARVITIASGKGGVGKTSLSVNLAIALTQLGCRVTLVDGDISLANTDVLCGLKATGHLGHVLDGTRTLGQIMLDAPGGFRLVPGASGVARLADLGDEDRDTLLRCLDELDATNDIIIIDTAAGIGGVVLSMLEVADLALVVTTPEPTAITDAYALIKCFVARYRASGAPIDELPLGLVVNQAADAPEAREVHERVEDVATRFLDVRLPFAGWVRADKAASECVRARKPLLVHRPHAPASLSITELGAGVCELLNVTHARPRPKPGLAARFLRLVGVPRDSGGPALKRAAN